MPYVFSETALVEQIQKLLRKRHYSADRIGNRRLYDEFAKSEPGAGMNKTELETLLKTADISNYSFIGKKIMKSMDENSDKRISFPEYWRKIEAAR